MPTKLQLEKAAWQWAESTDPQNVNQEHVNTAYRLNLKPCPLGGCKRNCRGNPFCLNAVGERPWFAKLETKDYDEFDPQSERREKDSYVGLKNLGATCYVNTFLQLWYHNLPVRRAIYQWSDPDMPDNPGDDWTPSSICGHLQLIFALLQFSSRRYIDPTSFINHLGLDTGQQQDAQEFSKLFLSLLEDAMSGQAAPGCSNVIQQQFCGEYCYVTRCKNCSTESRTASKYYELDLNIKGHRLLNQCVEDFLKEEKLEGENQYMCEACMSKQNATRAIQLQTLPPVLNIQLLRFVFDKNSGHKKKLNSFIQFPEVLDMSKYLRQPDNSTVYELTAVLIHRGPSAYSGHYVAHIKMGRQRQWYKFNDEEIEEMKGRNLHLGTEDEITESGKEKKGRVAKGCHSSKNAYMLVYTRQGLAETESPEASKNLECLLSPGVQQYVLRDNAKFEDWITELITARETKIESGKAEQEEMREKYLSLIYEPGCAFDWLSFDWITKWMADPAKTPRIKNKQYLCKHQKLDPDMVSKLKCVKSSGASSLLEKFKVDVRLEGELTLCWKCVRSQCHVIRMKQRMQVDEKLISAAAKYTYDSESCFWVGRSSLRSWKKIAIATFHLDTPEKTVDDDASPIGEEEKTEDLKSKENDSIEEPESRLQENGESKEPTSEDKTVDDQKSSLQFNSDLLCEHDCLNPEQSCRRLIPEDLWNRLRSYFPTCPQYRRDDSPCHRCQQQTAQEEQTKGLYRQSAMSQKAALGDLFTGKNRPQLVPNQQVYVVSTTFIEDWRKFIKENGKREPLTSITNSLLLCEHGGLLYPPTSNGHTQTHNCVCLLWPSEWSQLTSFVSCDVEISVVQLLEGDNSVSVVTTPELCKECVSLRLATEESNKFVFRDCIVYVRKLMERKVAEGEGTKNGTPVKSVGGMDGGEDSLGTKVDDPDYMQQAKKKKLEEDSSVAMTTTKSEDLNDLRRKSQRHRKTRGEKEVLVSSDMSVKDLKIKIMKQFSVPPFDQNLSLDGVALSDDTVTLQTIRMYPGAVVMLQADEPAVETDHIDDIIRGTVKPEIGFQGTSLLSS